jgi:hypothetical protein
MRFLVSAIVSIIRAGLGMEREVHTTWTVKEVPTLRELEAKVDAIVKDMIVNGDSNERQAPLVYDTYSFTVSGLFRVD